MASTAELEILIRSVADTQGIQLTSAELANLTRQAQAMSASTAAAGEGLGSARKEAVALGHAIETGAISARTLHAAFGVLGGPIVIATFAALGLMRAIEGAGEENKKFLADLLKQREELNKAVGQWSEIAKYAEDLGDQVRLADKIKEQIDKMSTDFEAFRSKELTAWQFWYDQIARMVNANPFMPHMGTYGEQRQQQQKQLQAEITDAVRAGNIELDVAEQRTSDWAAAQANLTQGIATYNQLLTEARAKLADLDAQAAANPKDKSVEEARRKALLDVKNLTNETKELKDQQDQLNRAVQQENRKNVAEALKEEESILQRINQKQQLTQNSPFLSADAKSTVLLQQYESEMSALGDQIERNKAMQQRSALDPVLLEELKARYDQLIFRMQLLGEKVQDLQSPMRTQLASWVNSWGTATHQIGNLLQEVIGQSLQELNRYLVEGQGNVKQLEQHFLEMGLTILEQLAIQEVAKLLGITSSVSAAETAGPLIAQAWAPAAAAVSTATFGASSDTGLTSELAAIAAIEGALVAHTGGVITKRFHSGALSEDEQLAVLQEGEIVINRQVAQQYRDMLLGINSGLHPMAAMGRAGIGEVDIPPADTGTGEFPKETLDVGDPGYYGSPIVQVPTGPSDSPVYVVPSGFISITQGGGQPIVQTPTESGIPYGGPTSLPLPPSILSVPNLSGNWWGSGGTNTFYTGLYSTPGSTAGEGGHAGGIDFGGVQFSRAGRPLFPVGGSRFGINTGGRSFHMGGEVTRAPRFHSGGASAGGGSARLRSGDINIAAFLDERQLGKWLSSRVGRKIMFDFIRGNKIDLGV